MRIFAAIIAALALFAASASPALATQPQSVTIAHHSTPSLGTFTANGAINDAGSVTRDAAKFSAGASPVVGTGQFVLTFHGARGDLTVRLQWLLTPTDDPAIGHIDGRWTVVEGTGAYAGLTGEGDYSATIDFVHHTRDALFTGQVH